ncbi:HutD family protein [Nocardioides ferulae]|uniref:HutD/Ves family protein n=1 Tax=Nocardioides ferulae TaxID=2340821 RepID=UPI001F0B8114|nr:HutD family protein [Nocardioides ferulae]
MLLDPARVDPTPWRNGAGSTRELSVAREDTGETRWRISLADLVRDAPFSGFPGMDRLLTALGPLRLTIDGTPVDLTTGEQVRFPGEAAVAVSLDRPTRALNVMTRRGSCVAGVVLRRSAHGLPPAFSAAPHVTVLLGDLLADVTFASPT